MTKPQFDFDPRPPSYAPFQTPALASDPLSMSLALILPQLLAQFAGPGSFLPEQLPGQNTADQFRGMNYRNMSLNTAFAASQMGNAAVSQKILGLMSAFTGGKATEMNRQHADFYAGILNNPIAKTVLSGFFGAETLEGFMFGKRGDPAQLAAVTSKIGFFRQAPTGFGRMNAQDMEQFTQGLHGALYGPEANIDDMRGLMAGQAGQLMEHLFQRGALPQSIGALSPADRVRLLNQNRDNAVLERVAREFGHREMMKDSTYAAKTEQEQQQDIEARLPEFRGRISRTFTEIDAFDKRRDRLSPEAREKESRAIEDSEEYKAIAANVDAKRVGQTLKDYAGAVSAVREIFGDNGNPNAPMSQLLAALEHLSNGAVNQMKPAQVESVLRQMRLAAKETGIGFEQLAQFSAQMSAYGDTLGISKPTTMLNTLTAMTMVRSMEETGAFSGNRFGQMTKADALEEVGKRAQRGAQSPIAKTMAAIRRAAAVNPALYQGSEVEKMVAAMNDSTSKGVYTYKGKTYDLKTMSQQEIAAKFTQSGGDPELARNLYFDPSTEEYIPNFIILGIQAGEMARSAAFRVNQDLYAYARENDKGAMRKALGSATDAAFEEDRKDFTAKISGRLQDAIMAAAGDPTLKSADIPEHVRKQMPELIKQTLIDRGMPADEAEKQAKLLLPEILGATDAKQRDALLRMQAGLSVFVHKNIGTSLTAEAGVQGAVANYMTQQSENPDRARRFSDVARGNESSAFARIGTILDKMGGGASYDISTAAKEALGVLKSSGIEDAYAQELADAFAAAGGQYADATLSEKDIAAVVDPALKNPNDAKAIEALKKLARVDANTDIISDADAKKELMALPDLADFYTKWTGGAVDQAKISDSKYREKLAEELLLSPGVFAAADILPGKQTVRQLAAKAQRRTYGAAGDTEAEIAQNEATRRNAVAIFDALKAGQNPQALDAGVEAMARNFLGGKADAALIAQLQKAASGTKGDEANTKEMEAAREAIAKLPGITQEHADVATKMLESLRDAKSVPEGLLSSTPDSRMREKAAEENAAKQDPRRPATSGTTRPAPSDSAGGVNVEQMAAAVAKAAVQTVQEQLKGRGGAGGADNKLDIRGTLMLQNMREGVIEAVGTPPQYTPNGGSPVYVV